MNLGMLVKVIERAHPTLPQLPTRSLPYHVELLGGYLRDHESLVEPSGVNDSPAVADWLGQESESAR